jgi:hypothetical protein
MDLDNDLMFATMMGEEATTTNEHWKALSCRFVCLEWKAAVWRLEAGALQEQAETEDGGLLHVVHQILCQ